MAEHTFQLVSNYQPTGDQPQAIARLVEGVERGDRCQTLLPLPAGAGNAGARRLPGAICISGKAAAMQLFKRVRVSLL